MEIVPLSCPLCEGRGVLQPDPLWFGTGGLGSNLWRPERALRFYRPFFESDASAQDFMSAVNRVPSSIAPARDIRDQSMRLVGLADMLCAIRVGGDILVMLLVVVAEAVGKLWFTMEANGGSKLAVRRFFLELMPPDVQQRLVDTLACAQTRDHLPEEGVIPVTDTQSAVDLLYDVRCDVAHEGKYRALLYVGPPDQSDADDTARTLRRHEEVSRDYQALRDCVIRTVLSVLDQCVSKARAAGGSGAGV